MTTIKTSELTGAALDWAVAEANETPIYRSGKTLTRMDMDGQHYWQPSTDWSQGGPIIEREKFDFEWVGAERCRATYDWLDEPFCEGFGQTQLIAAMRCYVVSKLGDTVEVPDELI